MKTARGVLLSAWGLMVLSVTAGVADVITIPPVRDNTRFEDATGSLSNGAGPVLYAGNNGQDLARRALLRFDVAGNLPPDARIESATLTVYVSNASNTIPRTFTLHRVLSDWGEGTSSTTSGSGAPATEGDATWLHTFSPGTPWASAGGDFEPTASASQSIAGIGSYSWSATGMATDVQSWLDDPAANFGWLIQSDEVTLNTARRFDSRENTVSANRPSLAITFTRTVGVGDETRRGRIELGTCRPNPALGRVRVEFVLPDRAHARLEVVDLAGRRVATLVDESLGTGRHEAVWNGQVSGGPMTATGVFFFRLVVDGRSISARRVVMMK